MKKQIHFYLRKKHTFDNHWTKKEKQGALSVLYQGMKKKNSAAQVKKKIHNYVRRNNKFDDLFTKKVKQRALPLW